MKTHNIKNGIFKTLSLVLILPFLNLIFVPTVSWAINTSMQDEYLGYSEARTDMVSLLTGNFGYTLPLMEVPSPEGSFPINITYSSNVSLESEAGWIGLGWNLNVGSVNRMVSGVPDDYFSNDIVTHYEDPGYTGNFINWGLWQSNVLKNSSGGIESMSGMANLILFQVGWGDKWSFSSCGITTTTKTGTLTEDSHTIVDPVGLVAGVVSIVLTIVSFGTLSAGAAILNYVISGIAAIVIADVINMIVTGRGATRNVDHWTFEEPSQNLGANTYDIYLDKEFKEKAFGTLYQGSVQSEPVLFGPGIQVNTQTPYKAPKLVEARGTGDNDISPVGDYGINTRGESMYDQTSPVHLAYDIYSVFGPNISGSIAPYRLDQGSIAISEADASEIYSFGAIPWTTVYQQSSDHIDADLAAHTYVDYKVPFRYLGDAANHYTYHATGDSLYAPRMDVTNDSWLDNFILYKDFSNDGGENVKFIIKDNDIIDSQTNRPLGKIESRSVEFGNNYNLVGSRFVDWKTNNELGRSEAQGFPKNGIGAFYVTGADGTTYHYTLPVYNNYFESYTGNVAKDKYTSRVMEDRYAIHWLLTGITRSDYHDRTSDGITEDDYGYWLILDYGKFTSLYQYRYPYSNDHLLYSPDGHQDKHSYEFGMRDVFYLETIRSRTHTAVFIKDVKKDGKGYFSSVEGSLTNPSSSLRLDQILLFTNEDWDYITDDNLGNYLHTAKGGTAGIDYNLQLLMGEKIEDVFDVQDLDNLDVNMTNYIANNQIQRIQFNQDNSLCDNTFNSFEFYSGKPPRTQHADSLEGKLTLLSVENYGKGNYKYMHDFEFDYYDEGGKNKDYVSYKWDMWGMYCEPAIDSYNGHNYKLSGEPNRDEDYWLLKKIIMPTGSEIEVKYERDNYTHICQVPFAKTFDISAYDNVSEYFAIVNHSDFTINNVKVGDRVFIKGYLEPCNEAFYEEYYIEEVDYVWSRFKCSFDPSLIGSCDETSELCIDVEDPCKPTAHVELQIDGGDTRVTEISVTDELGQKYTTKYDYNLFDRPNVTSGVISKEPPWSKEGIFTQHSYIDFPNTGVLYKNATVYTGYDSIDSSYIKKHTFEFEPPTFQDVVEEHEDLTASVNGQTWISHPHHRHRWYKSKLSNVAMHFGVHHNIVKVNRSKIGRINKIREYDANGFLVNSSDYNYADADTKSKFKDKDRPEIPGVRTEGAWLTYLAAEPEHTNATTSGDVWMRYMFQKTTKIHYPSVLLSTTVNRDGFKYSIENSKLDYKTGIILNQIYRNNLGYTYESRTTPAYRKYPEMGSKAINPNYKNMLNASAQDITYVIKSNDTLPIHANVQTWSNNWPQTNQAWRKHQAYTWESLLNKNGTFVSYTPFNFAGTPASGWKSIEEYVQFDEYSFPIEMKNFDNYSATRKDLTGRYILAKAQDAQLCEFSYSGAENSADGNGYFDGEFYTTGGATTDAIPEFTDYSVSPAKLISPHTGNQMFEMENGDKVILNLQQNGISTYEDSKEFIISYWYHIKNYDQSSLVPTIKFTESDEDEIGPNSANNEFCEIERFGDWYLHKYKFSIVNSDISEMEIVLESSNLDDIYIDDVRVQPLKANVVSYVMDFEENQILAKLNSDNLGVKYEYYENIDYKLNKLKEIHMEYMDEPNIPGSGGFKKTMEKDYNIVKY